MGRGPVAVGPRRRCRGAALGAAAGGRADSPAAGGAAAAPLGAALERALEALASARAAAEEAERKSGAGDLVHLNRLEDYITSLERTVGERENEVLGLRAQVAGLNGANSAFEEGTSLEISEVTPPLAPGTPPRDAGWLSPAEALDLYSLVENERAHKEGMARRAQTLCRSMKDLVRATSGQTPSGGREQQVQAVRDAILSLQEAAEASISEEGLATEALGSGSFNATAPRRVGGKLTEGLSSLKCQLAALTSDTASSAPPAQELGVIAAATDKQSPWSDSSLELASPDSILGSAAPASAVPAADATPASIRGVVTPPASAPLSPGSPRLPERTRTPPVRIARRGLWKDAGPAVRVRAVPHRGAGPSAPARSSKLKTGLASVFGVGLVLLVHTLDARERETLEGSQLWEGRG